MEEEAAARPQGRAQPRGGDVVETTDLLMLKLTEDRAYQNAVANSDHANLKVEQRAAVERAAVRLMEDGELQKYKWLVDNPQFREDVEEALERRVQQVRPAGLAEPGQPKAEEPKVEAVAEPVAAPAAPPDIPLVGGSDEVEKDGPKFHYVLPSFVTAQYRKPSRSPGPEPPVPKAKEQDTPARADALSEEAAPRARTGRQAQGGGQV